MTHTFSRHALGLVALSWLMAIAVPVRAVEKVDTTKIYPIEEVMVSSHRLPRSTSSITPLQVLTAEGMGRLQAMQISDALKHIPGVLVKDYGGIGGLKTISVRSLGSQHTVVSYDGVAVSDVQSGQIDLSRYSVDQVDQVSLVNGQSDRIFQSARMFASASVLELITLKPSFKEGKKVNTAIGFRGGSFGLLNPGINIQLQLSKRWSTTMSAEWMSAHGEYPYMLHYGDAATDSVSFERRTNSQVDNLRMEATLYGDFSSQEQFRLKAYFYASDRGLPGATIYYNTHNFSSQHISDRNFFVQSHYHKHFNSSWSLQAKAKYNNSSLNYVDSAYLDASGTLDQQYRQNELYGTSTLLWRLRPELAFSVSQDLSANTLQSNVLQETGVPMRLSSLSALAGKYIQEQWIITASMLYTAVLDRYYAEAGGVNRLTPFVSVGWKVPVQADWRLRAFYKESFRLPTFSDLFYARQGALPLVPEKAQQFNLGTTLAMTDEAQRATLTLTADIYHNKVKDKIVAYPSKNLFVWTIVNLGEVAVTGMDFSAESSLKLSPDWIMHVGGSYTYTKALDVTEPGGRTYGHQLPYTPRVSGSVHSTLATPWLDISYALLWSGKRYAGFQNYAENRLPGFMDHSLSFSREISVGSALLQLKAEILNLNDKNYSVVRYYPMPGRSFRFKISYLF